MSASGAAVGRAAFRAVHAKTGGKHPPKKGATASQPHGSNAAIIKEALRSLDPEQSKIEAAKNPNIVLAEDVKNENWVNDGNGGMKTATSFKEALDYLDSRNAQLFRKQTANDYELTELVVHLPDNLCIDDPHNVSYVLDEDGKQVISEKTGQPLTKPRRIPRDPDEARRYFDDVQAFFETQVIPGGHDGLHWRTDQYGEHRPHAQFGLDNYAPDPKHLGFLRNEFSRKWFSHRDVVYPEGHPKAGKSISGKVKLSDYQTAMREFMIAKGWPVEAEIDKANEGSYLGKKNYARADNNRIIAEDRLAAAREQEDQNLDDLDLIADSRKRDAARSADLDSRDQKIADDRARLDRELDDLPRLRAAAKAEGLDEAKASAETAVAARLAQAEADAQRIAESAQRAAQRARDAAEQEIAAERAKLTETPMAFEEFLAHETKEGRDTAARYKKRSEMYYLRNKTRSQYLNDHDRDAMRAGRKSSRPVIGSDAQQQQTSSRGLGE